MKKYLTTIKYTSSFIIEASTKKEALIIFEKNQKENFYIGINSGNKNSLSHNGGNELKFFQESLNTKAIKIK